jgi:hypothetical protein
MDVSASDNTLQILCAEIFIENKKIEVKSEYQARVKQKEKESGELAEIAPVY